MSGTKRWRLVVALVLAGAVLVGATAQAVRAGVNGLRAQRFLAARNAWDADGAYHNPLLSTAVVVVSPAPIDDSVFGEQINGEAARQLFLLYEAALDTAVVLSADGHVLEAKASGVPLDVFYEQALEWFGGAS